MDVFSIIIAGKTGNHQHLETLSQFLVNLSALRASVVFFKFKEGKHRDTKYTEKHKENS